MLFSSLKFVMGRLEKRARSLISNSIVSGRLSFETSAPLDTHAQMLITDAFVKVIANYRCLNVTISRFWRLFFARKYCAQVRRGRAVGLVFTGKARLLGNPISSSLKAAQLGAKSIARSMQKVLRYARSVSVSP
jgi:hypothetical protein